MLKIIKRLYTVEVFQLISSSLQSYLCRYFKLKRRVIFNSSFNKNYNFNSKYLFEYFLDNPLNGYEVKFVINDVKKRNELSKRYGNHFIETKSFIGKWYVLLSELWITSTLETPVFSLFKHEERKVYHLGHGIPLKKVGLAEEKITKLQFINRKLRTRLFTDVMSYSDNMVDIMKRSFDSDGINFVTNGQPRNDSLRLVNNSLKELFSEINKETKLILYAPTWRPYEKTTIFPFKKLDMKKLEKVLVDEDALIFLRTHPYYEVNYPKDIASLDRVKFLNSDIIPEIMDYINQFDVLVTDYSSIYLDYLPLNRPIIYIPYDLERYKKKVGFSIEYEKFAPGPKVNSFDEFITVLKKSISNNEYYLDERQRVNDFVNGKTDGNCKENYEYIVKDLLGENEE